jgi:hypothetical protein
VQGFKKSSKAKKPLHKHEAVLNINPKNAVAFFNKRNLWPNTASGTPIAEQWVGLSKYSHT